MNDETHTQPAILALGTEVPEGYLLQKNYSSAAARILKLGNTHTKLLNRIASGCQIDKRHTILPDFFNDDLSLLATTGKRNEWYKAEAPKLAEGACRKALGEWGGDPSSITHIISVSCTGMFAPGIEFLMIDRLGLSRDVERLGINFMGCFGAFKGLAIAKSLALESPENRVLVVCTELCSLHFQNNLNIDTLVSNSIFADGAAAAIVGMKERADEKTLFTMHKHASTTLTDTQNHMTWEPGDHGYQMRLSASVPSHIESSITPFVQRLIGSNLSFDQCSWAIHPGGKAILNSITKACDLQEEQVSASWKVLKNYGNMSSPTFLFVLKEVLTNPDPKKWVIGLGFGPGLSIEGTLLKREQ